MLAGGLALMLAAAGAAAAPSAGLYDARLCVTVSAQPQSCGAAHALINADGELRIWVDDIAYHLSFVPGGLVGITTHGSMQVAEFQSTYRWTGTTLQFGDAPRGLRYEVLLTPSR